MIKVQVSPLVLAAALGFLGPAALMDDAENEEAVDGLWARSGDASSAPEELGEEIQFFSVDDRTMLDSGTQMTEVLSAAEPGSPLIQHFEWDGAVVERTFHSLGDSLEVRTRVLGNESPLEFVDFFTRLG